MTHAPVQWTTLSDGSTRSVVYLWHVHHLGRRHKDNVGRVLYRRTNDYLNLVGVYAGRAEVEDAIERKRAFPGFREHPDCFFVMEYPLDTNLWPDGFQLEKQPRPIPKAAR